MADELIESLEANVAKIVVTSTKMEDEIPRDLSHGINSDQLHSKRCDDEDRINQALVKAEEALDLSG